MNAIDEFLLNHRLCADAYDWEEELARFLGEMDSVRRGRPGSLKMIPMALGTRPLPDAPVTVAAIEGVKLIVGQERKITEETTD